MIIAGRRYIQNLDFASGSCLEVFAKTAEIVFPLLSGGSYRAGFHTGLAVLPDLLPEVLHRREFFPRIQAFHKLPVGRCNNVPAIHMDKVLFTEPLRVAPMKDGTEGVRSLRHNS